MGVLRVLLTFSQDVTMRTNYSPFSGVRRSYEVSRPVPLRYYSATLRPYMLCLCHCSISSHLVNTILPCPVLSGLEITSQPSMNTLRTQLTRQFGPTKPAWQRHLMNVHTPDPHSFDSLQDPLKQP
jgi:hypothetical protein